MASELQSTTSPRKRFRIALSYASEKRTFVAKVADVLAQALGRNCILFDKYHEAEFATAGLGQLLGHMYHEQTDLVVAILCKDYQKKEWCGLEWDAIYGLIKKRKVESVMLSRFDGVEPPALFGLAGFVDLDNHTPEHVAHLILQRLAINEGHSRDHYMTCPNGAAPARRWPDVAPSLAWPVANHKEARDAFARLIVDNAQRRILPIFGNSETGKTHLTKQFLRNALQIPGLACGRFDFKGSTDIREELQSFAAHLNVQSTQSDATLTTQLAHVLTSLRACAMPSLLIFDTFELAGEAERWLNDSLLLQIVRASWLRVIVVGQRTVTPRGEPWADVSCPPIELRQPTAQDWFDYGHSHNPTVVTLDFVSRAHQCCGGKSSVLAQLFGPSA